MTSLPLPPPVTIAALRQHFKSVYQLGDSQVELMLQSSRKSMHKVLEEAENAVQAEDTCRRLIHIGHSLKGLLLNMGQPEWASVARSIEKAAREGEDLDYESAIARLSAGMEAIIEYGEEV